MSVQIVALLSLMESHFFVCHLRVNTVRLLLLEVICKLLGMQYVDWALREQLLVRAGRPLAAARPLQTAAAF